MVTKDWRVIDVAVKLPRAKKILHQYYINTSCCCGEGLLTLEQVASRRKIKVNKLVDAINKIYGY